LLSEVQRQLVPLFLGDQWEKRKRGDRGNSGEERRRLSIRVRGDGSVTLGSDEVRVWLDGPSISRIGLLVMEKRQGADVWRKKVLKRWDQDVLDKADFAVKRRVKRRKTLSESLGMEEGLIRMLFRRPQLLFISNSGKEYRESAWMFVYGLTTRGSQGLGRIRSTRREEEGETPRFLVLPDTSHKLSI